MSITGRRGNERLFESEILLGRDIDHSRLQCAKSGAQCEARGPQNVTWSYERVNVDGVLERLTVNRAEKGNS